jgi:3',5'-cyclic AMP phosphodiesterase CpdA
MKGFRRWRTLVVWALTLAPVAAGCSGGRASSPGPGPDPIIVELLPPPPAPQIAVLVGAGDIADCGAADRGANAEATAKLLDRIAGTIFTTGDNAYFNATAADFRNCYDPRWGRHKSRTYPSLGNHEYQSPGAVPYFDYFGDRAGPRGAGFYSYTLGNWHIISLNSEVGVSQGQEQYVWLRGDLEANRATEQATRTRCTLAYWHHPLFTSGPSAGTGSRMRDIWNLLYEFGVDVAITGHDHMYERYAPQDGLGRRDAFGIQEFIVGTGGAPLYDFRGPLPNSLFRLKAHGVLKLTLRDVGFDSVFIEAGTELQHDPTFSTICH